MQHTYPPSSRAQERLWFLIWFVAPATSGRVEITSPDPNDSPLIELAIGAPEELDALARGIEWVRRVAQHDHVRGWFGLEMEPGAQFHGVELTQWLRQHLALYYHAAGTCRLGPASDVMAVVDGVGRVHGFDNLYVADASLMPTIPRGMIHLSVYAVAERIAEGLVRSSSP